MSNNLNCFNYVPWGIWLSTLQKWDDSDYGTIYTLLSAILTFWRAWQKTLIWQITYLLNPMGDFIYKKKVYYNPVEFAMDQIGGTWKMPILWRLKGKIFRYGELKKDIPHITHKMLTTQLRELEADGFVSRKVYPVVPPKVEYSITKKGKECIKVIEVIRNYGIDLMKEAGVEQKYKKTFGG